ncbi:MAG: hypothetical protein ACR5K2_04745 [Wolbachia sp.]
METFGLPSGIYALHQGAIFRCFSLVILFASEILQKFGEIWCVISGTSVIVIESLSLVIFSITVLHSPYLIILSMIVFALAMQLAK